MLKAYILICSNLYMCVYIYVYEVLKEPYAVKRIPFAHLVRAKPWQRKLYYVHVAIYTMVE